MGTQIVSLLTSAGGGGGSLPPKVINVPADFPTIIEANADIGRVYIAAASVTDNDPTKTNTGQSFLSGEEFVWDGISAYFKLGANALWLDDGTDYKTISPARNIDLQNKDLKNVANAAIGNLSLTGNTITTISGDLNLNSFSNDIHMQNVRPATLQFPSGATINTISTAIDALATNTEGVTALAVWNAVQVENIWDRDTSGTAFIKPHNTGDHLHLNDEESTSFTTSELQIFKNDAADFTAWSASTVANDDANLNLIRSRGTIGTFSAVQDNDLIGNINFIGASSVANFNNGAEIRAEINGAVSAGVLPCDLVFFVNAGAGSASETVRFLKDKEVDINGILLGSGTFGAGKSLTAAGAGTRMIWYPKKGAFRAGTVTGTEWNDASIGDQSLAFNLSNTASGSYSVAMGTGCTASGFYSLAMGATCTAVGHGSVAMTSFADASANYSVAIGRYATASADSATAFGDHTTASGKYATAVGNYTTAQAYNSFVAGRYNVIAGTTGSWVATEPLFVLGIGANAGAPANAMTVLKNGQLFTPTLYTDAISTSTKVLSIDSAGQIGISTTSSPTFSQVTVDNLRLDGNTLSSTSGDLNLDPTGDAIINGHWKFFGKTLVAISDSDTTITAYAGKNITIEGATFDGGVVGGITALAVADFTITAGTIANDSSTLIISADNGENLSLISVSGAAGLSGNTINIDAIDSTVSITAATTMSLEAQSIGVTADAFTLSGSLTMGGAQNIKRTASAVDYNPSALTTDHLVAITDTSIARAVTISTEDIQSGSTANPRAFVIKDESYNAGTNNITVAGESGTINNQASVVIAQDGASITAYADGTNLHIY